MASFWTRLTALPASYLALWATLAVLTCGLVVLMRTRWGRERPTHRYVLLSLVGHLLLICIATTVHFISAPVGEESAAPVKVRIVMRSAPVAATPEPVAEADPPEPVIDEPKPVEQPTPEPQPEPVKPEKAPELFEPLDEAVSTEPPLVEASPSEPLPVPELLPSEPTPTETTTVEPDTIAETPPIIPTPPLASTPQAVPKQPTIEPPPVIAEAPPIEPIQQPIAEAPTWQSGSTLPVAAPAPPTPYGARTINERWRLVEQEGGSHATEDAVAAGLAWLASAQSNDGRWDADRWSAGRERHVLGHDRKSAGMQADTGVTALALLALMGAGHTHADNGPYAETIRLGLEYLLRSQASDGGLAGNASLYAQTYCHSMATFALAEALAHTRDARLTHAVRGGVNYLATRQNRNTGGWRYRPGDIGDMSQMGWIIMALRSAELGGVESPPATWSGIERFVDSVRRGKQGGLACYRRDGPTSRTMTAEALYCRQILGVSIPEASGEEAISALLGGPPGSGQSNLYYWYYATLALHHHRRTSGYADTAWQAWNDALTRSLVTSQVSDGTNAGSWSPNTLWGGYGGRVYSTAMATMCLEVYYRYDPQELARDPWIAARTGNGTLR